MKKAILTVAALNIAAFAFAQNATQNTEKKDAPVVVQQNKTENSSAQPAKQNTQKRTVYRQKNCTPGNVKPVQRPQRTQKPLR